MNLVEHQNSGVRHVISEDTRKTLCGKWITLHYADVPTWGHEDARAQVSCQYCERTLTRQGV
jgi:hypothetical protein